MTRSIHGTFRCNPRTLATVCAAAIDQQCLPEGFGRAALARFALEHLAASLPKYAALFPTEEDAWRYLIKAGLADEDLPIRKTKAQAKDVLALLDTTQEPSVEVEEPLPPIDESREVLDMMQQLGEVNGDQEN